MQLYCEVILKYYKMLLKIVPDKEKAKSMLNLIKNREDFLSSIDIERFPTIAAETYYEIIKELIATLLLLDGFKTTGEYAHKELIDYLTNYSDFSEEEKELMNDLRIKRNKSSYEGKGVDKVYIEDRKHKLSIIIKKLKNTIKKKL